MTDLEPNDVFWSTDTGNKYRAVYRRPSVDSWDGELLEVGPKCQDGKDRIGDMFNVMDSYITTTDPNQVAEVEGYRLSAGVIVHGRVSGAAYEVMDPTITSRGCVAKLRNNRTLEIHRDIKPDRLTLNPFHGLPKQEYPPSTDNQPTNNQPSKEDNIMSNAYDLAAQSVRNELDRQAREAADEAVAKHLKKVTKLIRKCRVGDVIRVWRPDPRHPDVTVWSKGTDGRWYETTNSSGHTDDGFIKHIVASCAEGGSYEKLVPEAKK